MDRSRNAQANVHGPWWSERRLGWRAELSAGVVLAVLLLGIGLHYLLVQATSPDATAVAYLQAKAGGDVDRAWDSMTIAQSPSVANGSLLDKVALRSFLRVSANRPAVTDVHVQRLSTTGDAARVVATFHEGTITKTQQFSLVRDPAKHRFLFYPAWRVAVTPAVLSTTPPAGAGEMRVDGLALPQGANTLAIFPGAHELTVAPSAQFVAASTTVVATDVKTATRVKLGFKLTDSAVASATNVIRDRVRGCAAATVLTPPGCPQALTDTADGPVRWELFGDPAANIAYSVTPDGETVGTGYYQMAATFTRATSGERVHRAVGNPYEAKLAGTLDSMSVSGFATPASSAPAQRPVVDDAIFKGVLKGQFDRCAAASDPAPADCPQSVTAANVSAFSWKMEGDPVADAKVSFDSARSLFQVTGIYSMTASYDYTFPYQPTRHATKTTSGSYKADFFWDGQKPVFVTFESP